MTATNGYGQASATSAGVGPIVSTQPTPVSVPTVSGTTQRTYQLTATSGVWTGPNLTYAYQWQRSPDGSTWQSIAGATSSTYTLAVADEGDQVRVVASASNPTGVASQSSAASQVISPYPPANTTAPAITGTAKRGRTLTASRGVWTGPDNNYAYQWQEDFGEGYVDIVGRHLRRLHADDRRRGRHRPRGRHRHQPRRGDRADQHPERRRDRRRTGQRHPARDRRIRPARHRS